MGMIVNLSPQQSVSMPHSLIEKEAIGRLVLIQLGRIEYILGHF